MGLRRIAILLLAAAGCGRGGSPAASGAAGPVDGTIAFRNRMTDPVVYAELEVAGAKTVLPVLPIDSAISVDFTAPVGTPLVLKWQNRNGVRTDTVGTVSTAMVEGMEYALTDVGVVKVGKAAD